MADKKISQLTAATTPLAGTEVLPIVQSGSTVKVSVADVTAGRAVSVASVAVTGSSAPANGVYLPAANNVAIATNSGEKVRVDANGNVLVGATANPDVLNKSVVIDSGASSLAGVVLQNDATGRAYNDGGSVFMVNTEMRIQNSENAPIFILTNNVERMRIDNNGTVRIGTAALATTATDGFLYIPTCAGTPTGTPTAITGLAPIVVNTTNNKLYFYSGGAWRDAGP